MRGEPAHRPRQIVHRGVVEAAAILVDEAIVGAREARLRVVRAWSPGASVIRAGSALCVRFPAPRRVDCARAPGLPLVRVDQRPAAPLASAPLAPDEIAASTPPPGSIVIVRAGAIAIVVPAEADREDPSAYLDLDAFDVIRVEPLGAPPPPPAIVGGQTIVSARALLGVGAASAEQAEVAAAIAALRAGRAPLAGARERDERRRAALSFFTTLVAAALGLVGRIFGFGPRSRSAALPSASGSAHALAAHEAEPAGPTIGERIAARMRSLLATLLVRARLAHLVGRRQAEYVGKLLDMLDRGDLTEALRHAIPLGGASEGPSAPALGVPQPRSDLTISLGRRGVATSMFAADDLYAHLKAKYRAAFERLEREGRIDEAAFVLAELLHEEAEAVAFLERHGRLRLAAELAESRKLPPGLVVRQWFLAGDAARAIRIARRHGAFADAVLRLEEEGRAPELRILWAETLAEAGDFAAAIDAIWPVEPARGIAGAWIDRAIAQGGAVAARMLVKKLAIAPDTFADVRDRAMAILGEQGPRASIDRRALAEALTGAGPAAEVRTIARAAARALARDGGISGDRATQQLVAKLVTMADDAALRADMPSWPTTTRTPLAEITTPRTIEIAAADTGTMEVHHAAYLPNGSAAIALGEAGVRVIARSGKSLFHLDQPAYWLAISDHGDRAIAMAPRGEAVRLARLDLVGRRSEPWCEASVPIGSLPPTAPALITAANFDGASWPVAADGKLLIVDALESRFAALDTIDLGDVGLVETIARSSSSCTIAGARDGKATRARWELPGWTLRARTSLGIAMDPAKGDVLAARPEGAVAVLTTSKRDGLIVVHADNAGTVREARLGEGRPLSVTMRGGWIACAEAFADRIEVHLIDEPRLASRARVILHGAKRASFYLGDDTWTIACDRGRVIVLDLAYGGVIHDLRV